MRLYNIFYICKSYLPLIKETKILRIGGRPQEYAVHNWKNCKKALDEIRKIKCFEEIVDRLYCLMDAYNIRRPNAAISSDVKTIFSETLLRISSSVEIIVKLYDMAEIGEAGSGIDVKIPKCESLKEYMQYLKDIDFIFTQCPYLLHEKEEIKFKNVDVGSQWLAFAVVGAPATFCILNNLAKLVGKAIELKSNILVCKQQEEALEEMRQKNEVGRETIDAFKKLKQITMDKCVADLENDIGKLNDNEERDKVKRTVESLALLMDKGVEIYSSIETPKEIKVLFPFEKNTVILPDNIQKLIEDKLDSKNENE